MNKENIIDSLETYIKYITYLREDYPSSPLISSPIDTRFLFRGISNREYSLLPSVYRTHQTPFEDRNIENSLYLAFANESAIIKEFRNEARRYIVGANFDKFINWAEYAQHFGVPTRFLDWSSNPLVALYFACNSSETNDGVVWCLHKMNYLRFSSEHDVDGRLNNLNGIQLFNLYEEMLDNKKDLPCPIIYIPNYIDSRMSMQSSYFMLWGNDQRPLDQIIGEEYYIQYKPSSDGVRSYGIEQGTKIFMKLMIPSDRKQPLLRNLDMLGINKKTLFPGLDGLGEHLKWKYQFNSNDEVF